MAALLRPFNTCTVKKKKGRQWRETRRANGGMGVSVLIPGRIKCLLGAESYVLPVGSGCLFVCPKV